MKYLLILLSAVAVLNINAERVKKPQPEKPEIKRAAPKPFPKHWGHPPRIQVRDMVPLPSGFGKGSSTLAKWIANNIRKDKGDVSKPERSKPPADVHEKLKVIQEKRKALDIARKELSKKLFEDKERLSKEAKLELIRKFKETHKDKHEEVKIARKDLVELVRSKRQEGARRE